MSDDRMMVFAGNANPELARKIVDHLGISLGQVKAERFSDGEAHVEIMENVRGRDVFIVQPTCAPTNDNLLEMLIMSDALISCISRSDYCCGSLLWLCAPGSPGAFPPGSYFS